jgi:hypothetical protein
MDDAQIRSSKVAPKPQAIASNKTIVAKPFRKLLGIGSS